MGTASSKRRNNWHHQNPPSSLLLSSSAPSSSTPPLAPPPPSSNPPLPPISGFSTLPPPPPPPPPPSYVFAANAPYPSGSFPHQAVAPYPPPPYPAPAPAYHFYSLHSGAYANPVRVFGARANYPYYAASHGSGWWPPSPHSASSSSLMVPPQPPPPYVEHQKAVTIKNDVNLHKGTIRLEPDEQNPNQYLVSFTFDSYVDGSITIFYFAKEGANCIFSPVYPDIYMPVRVPFLKGLGQKFRQPSGSGIDVGFFELEDLSKPSQGDVFPLVISAEACLQPLPTGEELSQPPTASRAQITQGVIEKKGDGQFQVKVIKQILWVDGGRYELKEIFGLANSAKTELDGDGLGKECVICLSESTDTAVLPCRHMCMCSECAKALRLQSNKCPICRQPVEELREIKVKNSDSMEIKV